MVELKNGFYAVKTYVRAEESSRIQMCVLDCDGERHVLRIARNNESMLKSVSVKRSSPSFRCMPHP